jgi:hypothetical protein
MRTNWTAGLLAGVAIAGLTGCASSSDNGSQASQLSAGHPLSTMVELAYAPLFAIPDWEHRWSPAPLQALRSAALARTAQHDATAAHNHVRGVVAPAAPAAATLAAHADPLPRDSASYSTHSVTRKFTAGDGSTTTTITTTKTATIDGKTTQSTQVQTTGTPPS